MATASTLLKIWSDGGTLYDEGYDNARLGFEGKEETLADQVKAGIEFQGGISKL
jgi:hypothetical protein